MENNFEKKIPIHNEQPKKGVKIVFNPKKQCFYTYLEKRAREDEEEKRTGKIKD
jgi:hypothetical protein